jgi:cytochrome P450
MYESPVTGAPVSDLDLHADSALLDPYPLYRELRGAGGAVWMRRYGMFALPRYADVRNALANWQVFSSARGVMFNEATNERVRGIPLVSDPPEHERLRRPLKMSLAAKELSLLESELSAATEALVERLVERKTFDAVSDFAQFLPMFIVTRHAGLPEEGRERTLEWADAIFNTCGPLDKQRTREALPLAGEQMHYLMTQAVPGKLTPGGWGQRLYDDAERGELAREECPVLMTDLMAPSLYTTIHATSSAVWLFGRHPDQWDEIRADPSLIPNAINEILRLESPAQGLTRYVTRDHTVGGVTIPAGSRVMVLYASANRDERKWKEPERFDVRREGVAEHLAWGFGPHACVGSGLARLELKVLLAALARRVRRFELGEVERGINMVLRGLRRLEVTVS